MASDDKPLSGQWAAFILIVLTVAMVFAAWFLGDPGKPATARSWSYVLVLILMVGFAAALGLRISGRPAGILINERNLMSLSRFQMVLWTMLIISAFLIAAISRIRKGGLADALAIGLDEKLWALMGISTASLVGTPLILGTKKDKDPDLKSAEKTAAQTGETSADVLKNRQGLLYSNASINDAAFSDMFEGDEVGNTTYVDVAKVQMFFFTVVAALSYGLDLFKWLGTDQIFKPLEGAKDVAFPVLSAGLIAILGISHGGFLVNKSIDHTTQPPPPPPK